MGRPRVLDEGKQREVCALLTAGMTVGEAAAYVGCCEKTIRREQARDEDFDERVRRARMHARLGPLQAVRQAAATHWRAAAWLVDRQDRQEERERRARREQAKRKQQREKAQSRRPPQSWNLEQEIEQIAAARPPAGSNATRAEESPLSPRRQPGEPTSVVPRPTSSSTKPTAPVAAAMRDLARQVAVTASKPQDRAATADATRQTKPPLRLADEPAAEPTKEGQSSSGGDPDARGFVPSLRIFGQNEAVAPNAGEQVDPVRGDNPTASAVGCGEDCRREPPASAGGAESKSPACRAGCSGG